MKQINIFIIMTVVAILTYSCNSDDSIGHVPQKTLVVEGWIEDGEPPVVMVSQTINVTSEEQKTEDLYDNILKWAYVEVSDGDNTVVLTGRYDAKFMPPYIYSSVRMKGQAGKQYTLKVKCDSMTATATTTIPPSVSINRVRSERVLNSDTLSRILVSFTDPPSKNYYAVFSSVGEVAKQFFLSNASVTNDNIFTQSNVTLPVYRGSTMLDKNNSEYFHQGDTVCVKLLTLTEDSYNYWKAFQDNVFMSNNFALSYSKNLINNINGGVGYWNGYGMSKKWIIVE